MSRLRRVLALSGAAGLLVAGCTAAAQLRVLQPAGVPSSPPLAVPSATPAPPRPAPAKPARMQLGVDIDAYTYQGQDVAGAASTVIAYIASLHANAVSISFPFFVNGVSGSEVYGSSATPAPAQLALIVRAAERAGLRVSIRPLLDERSIGKPRTGWRPADPAAWFASYRRFLQPYAAMAQRLHVPTFIVGAELSKFAASGRWTALDESLGRVYRGTFACASNWTGTIAPGNCGQGAQQLVDAYHPTGASLLAGWQAYDRTLPPGTVLSEVGIAAAPMAYQRPYLHSWPISTPDPGMQARWFTAACQAAAAGHLGGIYFWSLGLTRDLTHGPSVASQGTWAYSAGAAAIARCFGGLERATG